MSTGVADTNSYPYVSQAEHTRFDLSIQPVHECDRVATTTAVALSSGMGNLFTIYQTTLIPSWYDRIVPTPNNISGVGNTIGEFTFTAGVAT